MNTKFNIFIISLLIFGCSTNYPDIDYSKYKYADSWNNKIEALNTIKIKDSIMKIDKIFGKPRFKHQDGDQLTYHYTKTDGYGCIDAIEIKFEKYKVTKFETFILCVDPW